MASSCSHGSRKPKTLKYTLLETIVLYADDLFDPAKTKCLGTEGRTSPFLSQHLVGEILAISHNLCWKIPEKILMAGDLILNKVDSRDRSFMNKSYYFNTGTFHSFDDYKKPVAMLRIPSGSSNYEMVRRIASFTHTLKEVEVEQQNMTPQELDNWASTMKRDGPLLELTRLRADCHVRSLPFRFEHRSLKILEIRTNNGLMEWLETISECTNLTNLLVDCSDIYWDTIEKLVYAIPIEAKLRILCLPSNRLSEKAIGDIMSRLTSLELLEVHCLQQSSSNSPNPKKKLKYFLCSRNDLNFSNLDTKNTFYESANSLAHKVGCCASVDGLLTLCEYTQNEWTFECVYFSLLSELGRRIPDEISASDITRIERVVLIAAKNGIKATLWFSKVVDRIKLSDEFMLRMSCLNRGEFEPPERWDRLERFIEEFVRVNEGSQLARRFKERMASYTISR